MSRHSIGAVLEELQTSIESDGIEKHGAELMHVIWKLFALIQTQQAQIDLLIKDDDENGFSSDVRSAIFSKHRGSLLSK